MVPNELYWCMKPNEVYYPSVSGIDVLASDAKRSCCHNMSSRDVLSYGAKRIVLSHCVLSYEAKKVYGHCAFCRDVLSCKAKISVFSQCVQ